MEKKVKSNFDENKACYCSLCERTYKNYKRYSIHMKKKHYTKEFIANLTNFIL